MKYKLLTAALLSICAGQQATAQSAKIRALEQEILAEGLALYESECASWVATDLLMAQQPDVSQLGGYLSYADGDSLRTIFVQRNAVAGPLRVLHSFSFGRTSVTPEAFRQSAARPASEREQRLFSLRQQVMQELQTGRVLGESYEFPASTRPNVVVLDQGAGSRAYVLAGPQEAGVLPIGNDFLLRFTATGKLHKVERLHNTYLPLRLPTGNQTVEAGMHSHLPAHPYITATDICSLLLYQSAFPAEQHLVMGKDYVSIFDVPKRQLTFLTRKAFTKISTYQKERSPTGD